MFPEVHKVCGVCDDMLNGLSTCVIHNKLLDIRLLFCTNQPYQFTQVQNKFGLTVSINITFQIALPLF